MASWIRRDRRRPWRNKPGMGYIRAWQGLQFQCDILRPTKDIYLRRTVNVHDWLHDPSGHTPGGKLPRLGKFWRSFLASIADRSRVLTFDDIMAYEDREDLEVPSAAAWQEEKSRAAPPGLDLTPVHT